MITIEKFVRFKILSFYVFQRQPRMTAHLFDADALCRVNLQHLLEQVDGLGAYILPHWLLKENLHLHELPEAATFVACGLMGECSSEEDVEDDSKAVDVGLEIARLL